MKKTTVSLLAISFLFLVLCSCKSNIDITPSPYFSAVAKITTQDTTVFADVESSVDGLTVTFKSPDNLKGLTYRYVNSTLYIDYHGLKCITNSDYLSYFNPICVIYDTVESLRDTPLVLKENINQQVIFAGKSERGDYTLYSDANTGKLSRIIPMYTECEITFTYEE